MRTQADIRARIAEIESDDRLAARPATVHENAPLALIQLEGYAVAGALRWALGEAPRCAGSYPTKLQAVSASVDAAELPPLSLEAYEAACVLRALEEAGGEPQRAARALGVGKSTIYRMLAKHRIPTRGRAPAAPAPALPG